MYVCIYMHVCVCVYISIYLYIYKGTKQNSFHGSKSQ